MSAAAPRPLFIAATRQHVGKTTVSLAVLSGLRKRFGDRVGFVKPVGQQHVPVGAKGIRVDKDVQLMKEYFGLNHLRYEDMSPVLVPRDYTKRFIDGEVSSDDQTLRIQAAVQRVQETSDVLIYEGTGHVGVGAIIDASNADVARRLDADVVLVANGGIGSAFDELEVNRAVLKDKGVRLRGVVLNKVVPDKVEQVRDYVGRAIQERWGVPLLGVVPDLPFLGKATLGDLERLLDGELISGRRYRDLHFGTQDLACVTTAVRRFLRKTHFRQSEKNETRPLFVTHCTRDDVLLAFLAYYKRSTVPLPDGVMDRDGWLGAMVLCKGECDMDPKQSVEDNTHLPYLVDIARAYDAPVMLTKLGTVEATNVMANFTAKMHVGDRSRIQAAIDHYEPHIDFEKLLG